MKRVTRCLLVLAAAGLLFGATGCYYDYGYYNVGYGYDCAPRYHTSWGYSSYHGPYYGVSYSHYGYGGHHYHCD